MELGQISLRTSHCLCKVINQWLCFVVTLIHVPTVPPVVVAVNRSFVAVERQTVTISFLVEQAIPPVQPWNLQWLYSSFLNSTSPNGDNITNVTNRTLTSSFSFSAFVNSTSISLTITNVQLAGPTGGPTDDGRYFLVATNPAGSSSDYVDLVVEGMLIMGKHKEEGEDMNI